MTPLLEGFSEFSAVLQDVAEYLSRDRIINSCWQSKDRLYVSCSERYGAGPAPAPHQMRQGSSVKLSPVVMRSLAALPAASSSTYIAGVALA